MPCLPSKTQSQSVPLGPVYVGGGDGWEEGTGGDWDVEAPWYMWESDESQLCFR